MKLWCTLLVTIIFSMSILPIVHTITKEDIDGLRIDLMNAFDTFSNNHDSADNKPLIASTVRLVFHDCAGPLNENHESSPDDAIIKNDVRLCDGCIDMTKKDHAGLENFAILPLEDVYVDGGWFLKMNGADFYVAAGNIALEYAHHLSFTDDVLPPLDYKFGRTICSENAPNGITNRGTEGTEFPMAHLGWDHLDEFMETHFGFDFAEHTAIIGAHTLGRAHPDASGFNGRWTHNSFVFDNTYFKLLTDKKERWKQTGIRQNNGLVQWENFEHKLIMLNPDISLLADMEEFLDQDNGVCTCALQEEDAVVEGVPVCPEELVHDIAIEFGQNNQKFLNVFAQAWNKLISNNYDDLVQIQVNRFSDPRNDGKSGNCCWANDKPKHNGRCYDKDNENECLSVIGSESFSLCYWDALECRSDEENDCKLRFKRCERNRDCCSRFCYPARHICR